MAPNDKDDVNDWLNQTWPELMKEKKNLEGQLAELEHLQEQGDMLIKDSQINLVKMKLN